MLSFICFSIASCRASLASLSPSWRSNPLLSSLPIIASDDLFSRCKRQGWAFSINIIAWSKLLHSTIFFSREYVCSASKISSSCRHNSVPVLPSGGIPRNRSSFSISLTCVTHTSIDTPRNSMWWGSVLGSTTLGPKHIVEPWTGFCTHNKGGRLAHALFSLLQSL